MCACLYECVHAYVCACARAPVRACIRACMHRCVRLYMACALRLHELLKLHRILKLQATHRHHTSFGFNLYLSCTHTRIYLSHTGHSNETSHETNTVYSNNTHRPNPLKGHTHTHTIYTHSQSLHQSRTFPTVGTHKIHHPKNHAGKTSKQAGTQIFLDKNQFRSENPWVQPRIQKCPTAIPPAQ